jgi:hypothetical protein
METVRAKIGATYLDLVRPGWAGEINLDTLSLSSCEVCVLGQLYGNYWRGAEHLFAMRATGTLTGRADTGCEAAATEAGFNLPEDVTDYAPLTAAWKREIRKRLAAEVA